MSKLPIKQKKITIFGFFSLTASMILTVYSYPVLAASGFSLIFFLLAAALLFFIPTALVSAELATGEGWEVGGVYKWCSVALGKRWGFFAIFLQWAQITVGFLAMLYFIVGSLSYAFDLPSLNSNPAYKTLMVIIVFWLLTIVNFKGAAFSSKLASYGVILGVVVPMVTLVILVLLYVITGHSINITLSWQSFFPDFTDPNALTIFITFILAYAGIEASAVHVNEMQNPKKSYPVALALLSVFAILVAILGSLSIAIVIPGQSINMSSGVLQSFEVLLTIYHLTWLTYIFAFLLAIGALAEVSSWIIGPIEGIYAAAKENILPKELSKTNKNEVPVRLITIQAVIVSGWAFVITLGGGGSNLSFIIAMALAVLIYLAMYTLLFVSYFILKWRYAEVKRSFIVPGGKIGRNLIPLIGLVTVILAIYISIYPPSQIAAESAVAYEAILFSSFIIVMILPHIIYSLTAPKHTKEKALWLHCFPFNKHHRWIHLRGRGAFQINLHKFKK